MKEYRELCLSIQAAAVFKNVKNDETVRLLLRLLSADCSSDEIIGLYGDFAASLYRFGDDLPLYIAGLLLKDENAFVKSAAKGEASPVMKAACENELKAFSALAEITSGELKEKIKADIPLPDWTNRPLDIAGEYENKIKSISLTGYGIYAQYRMFLFKNGEVVPVKYPDPQRLSQMKGYENERQRVIDNTLALLHGKPCCNTLLYGDAGSGKSSTVKAIVNEYYPMGLRLVEIKKNQLYSLPELLDILADNPLKFIIFIDDLSFSAADSDFGALKAVIEGGAAGKHGNTVIYATSNRRNLVKESFGDRNGDDIHIQDTVQEITSLSARFGLKVTFTRPDKDLYLAIAEKLAGDYNIEKDTEELYKEAEAFALRNGGRSPRTAKQFIEFLASKK